jgi:hypothetical protein
MGDPADLVLAGYVRPLMQSPFRQHCSCWTKGMGFTCLAAPVWIHPCWMASCARSARTVAVRSTRFYCFVCRLPAGVSYSGATCGCLGTRSTGCFEAASSGPQMSAQGRKRTVAASGSSHWPVLVIESLTCLRAPPSPNVKFRGTADSRLRSRPRSGIAARRHSPAQSHRPQTVCTCLWP